MERDIETMAVHAGERRPGPEGSMVFPIYQGTVYGVSPGTGYDDIRYLRLSSTPTQRYLHEKLAGLEGAEAALATASGMAAVASALLTLLEAGDHLLAASGLYGGTHELLAARAPALGWSVDLVDAARPETWAAKLSPRTKVFLVETISNPLLRVPRLAEVVSFSREHGLTTVIDNTFASPVNFRPLTAGFDLCFHSATKYLGGHSDLVAGCLCGRAELIERVRRTVNLFGASLDPHVGFLLARGIKTLALRVKAQNENATALSRFLEGHPAVLGVNYPGLSSHPDHGHATELLAGFGGVLSFRLRGGVEAADSLMEALTIPFTAPSLGGVETLITRPVTTSHAGMSAEDRARTGVTDDLVRVACGVESARDLIGDFASALERVGSR